MKKTKNSENNKQEEIKRLKNKGGEKNEHMGDEELREREGRQKMGFEKNR